MGQGKKLTTFFSFPKQHADGGDFILGKNEQQQQLTVYMKGDKVALFCTETFSPAMVLLGSGWVSSILIIKDQLYINYN